MERVNRIKFNNVDQVDADQFTDFDRNGAAHKLVSNGVDGINFVTAVKVRVEGIHHHHEFTGRRTTLLRIDDKCAIHTFMDVSLERCGMAMIQVTTERVGIKLVGKRLTGINLPSPYPRNAIHFCGMKTMKMDSMRMCAEISEVDAQAISLSAADRWPRYTSVITPGREEDAWRNLNLVFACGNRVFT